MEEGKKRGSDKTDLGSLRGLARLIVVVVAITVPLPSFYQQQMSLLLCMNDHRLNAMLIMRQESAN